MPDNFIHFHFAWSILCFYFIFLKMSMYVLNQELWLWLRIICSYNSDIKDFSDVTLVFKSNTLRKSTQSYPKFFKHIYSSMEFALTIESEAFQAFQTFCRIWRSWGCGSLNMEKIEQKLGPLHGLRPGPLGRKDLPNPKNIEPPTRAS